MSHCKTWDVNNANVNNAVQVSFQVILFPPYIYVCVCVCVYTTPTDGIAESYSSSIFSFLRNQYTILGNAKECSNYYTINCTHLTC